MNIVNWLINNVDKVLHFLVCLLISLFSGWIHPLFIILALLVGVYKEWRDSKTHYWCWWDLLADTCGATIGILPYLVLYLATGNTLLQLILN